MPCGSNGALDFMSKNNFILWRLILSLSVVSLAACSGRSAKRWTRDAFDLQQWNVDTAECQREAAQMFPPQFVSYQSPGYTAPTQTNCSNIGGNVNCTTSGGESYPITTNEDLNEDNRSNAWESCIRARQYVTADEAAKRPVPQLTKTDREIVSAVKEYGLKFRAICSENELQSYFQKNPCKVGGSKEDKAFASHSEKSAAKKVRLARDERGAEFVAQLEKIQSSTSRYLLEVASDILRRSRENYDGLIEGRLTWGTHNKIDKDLVNEMETKVAAAILDKRPRSATSSSNNPSSPARTAIAGCPNDWSPATQPCSSEEKERGCIAMRTPSGTGCKIFAVGEERQKIIESLEKGKRR